MDGERDAHGQVAERRGRSPVRLSVAGLMLLLVAGSSAALMAPESRRLPVGEFDRVYFSGAGSVQLTQGSAAALEVRGAPDLLDSLRVETRDGALYIESSGLAQALVVELQVADLKEFVSEGDARIAGVGLRLEGNGAGSFHMERLEAQELEVQGRGATRFDLTGQVGRQVVNLSGTGAYRAGELISNRTAVTVAGASDVRLWADELLDVQVAGSAAIRYAGSPRVEQRISGVASLLRIPQIAI